MGPGTAGHHGGALFAVLVGANEPTFTFSVGVSEAGDLGALLPVGPWCRTGLLGVTAASGHGCHADDGGRPGQESNFGA